MVITVAATLVLIVIIVVFVKCGYIPKFQALDELGSILLGSTGVPLLIHTQSR
jgi:hypothetical protein